MGGARHLLLTATILLTCQGALTAQSRIQWVGSWAEAQSLAAQHQRLVLAHFWSPDCAPCQKLEQSVFNQPECIRAIGTNYVAWKVNVAENPTVARDLRVDRWPTDVILSPTGQVLYRGASPADMNRYAAMLDQIAAHARVGMTPGVDATASAPSSGLPPMNSTSPLAANPPAANSALPPSGGYQPPVGYSQVTNDSAVTSNSADGAPAVYQPSNAFAAPPTAPANTNVAGAPALPGAPSLPAAGAAAPPTAAYVDNQWAASGAPAAAAAAPPAEQPASYLAPYGGAFQPPAGTSPQAPASAVAKPSSGDATASPALGVPINTASAVPPAAQAAIGPPTVPPAPADPTAAATLGPPTQVETPPAAAAAPATAVGLDGYCPVTLVEQEKWVKGDRKWGARHRGRLYLFVSPAAQQRFLDSFEKYAPALSGYDPVKYSDQGALVEGKRAHGVFYRSQIYLFADEAGLQQFWADPERYAATVRAEHERSAMRTNTQR